MSAFLVERRRRSGSLRVLAFGLKVAVSAGLLLLLARSVDLRAVGTLLGDLPLLAGLAAAASLAGICLVSALRWWLVLRAIGSPLPLGRIIALMFVGHFFTQVLPTSVGGDAVRIWQVTRQGIPFQRAFNGVMLERISGLIALAAMVCGGMLWLGDLVEPPVLRLLLLCALPVLAAGLAVLCLLDRLRLQPGVRLSLLRPLGGLLTLAADMAADSRRVLLSQPLSLVLLLLSTVAQLLSVLAMMAIAQGLGVALAPGEALAVVPAIILITFMPLSFAGWGVREGASVVMLGIVGVAPDQALAVSVLFGLALLPAALPGCLLWLTGGRRLPPAA